MTDPAIAAALREAEKAPTKAAAVVAFLRALPERFSMPGDHNHACQVWGHAKGEMRRLANLVKRAAKEAGDD